MTERRASHDGYFGLGGEKLQTGLPNKLRRHAISVRPHSVQAAAHPPLLAGDEGFLSPKGVSLLWARFTGEQAADQRPCILSTSLLGKTSQLLLLPHRHTVSVNTRSELHSYSIFAC